MQIKKFDTGDRVQDYNLADHYIKERDGGRIVGFPDCVCVVIDEEFD